MDNDNTLDSLIALKKAYQDTFNTPAGKIVLEDLSGMGYSQTTTMPKDSNSHRLAYNEGKRVMYVRVMNMMNLDLVRIKQALEAQQKEAE